MTVLVLGLATLFGAGWMTRRSAPGRRSCLWVLAIGVLTAGQTCWQRDRLVSYQVRLLGQRFQPGSDGLVAEVSGDRDRADYYLPGAGNDPVAVLQLDSAGGVAVRAPAPTSAAAVAVVTTPRRWRGGDRVVLGSVPVEPGDRIRVGGEGATEVFTFARSRVSLLQRARIGGTRDQLALGSGDAGDAGGPAAIVPYPEGAGVLGLLPRRPGVYQRTYPLAELAAAGGFDGPGVAGLRSFLYYREGSPRLAVLDDLVEVLLPDGTAKAPVESASAWPGSGRTPVVTVAGLPYRDFPDPGLAAGERYGARPLRSFRARVDGEWVTVQGARAEVHSVETAGLPPATLAPSALAGGSRGGSMLHLVRLAVGDAPEGPAGLTFASPSNVFAAAGEAVLRLPQAPSAGWFELLSPSGQARWETGRPFTLSDGEKGLLLRVDGLAASWSFLLLLTLLFLLAAAPFALVETTGAVRGLALAALGIAALRVLLSLSAMARYPFVDEGHQIGLWLVPALPWFVCALGRKRGETSAADGAGLAPDARAPAMAPPGAGRRDVRPSAPWSARANVAAAALGAPLIFLAAALFPTTPAKSLVLSAAVVCAAVIALLPMERSAGGAGGGSGFTIALLPMERSLLAFGRGAARLRRLAKALPARLRKTAASWPGAAVGLAIVAGRVVLDAAGFREQIALGGTRIGLSVLHTPVALIAFALLASAHHRRVAGAARARVAPAEDARAAPTEDARAAPTEDGRAAPTEDGRAAPTEDGRAAPTEDGRAAPTEDGRAAPTEDARAAPMEDGRAAPAEDARTAPTEPAGWGRTAGRSLIDLCAFLAFAYVGTSVAVSDFGIAFTTLPGPLVVLALLGTSWARAKAQGRPDGDGKRTDSIRDAPGGWWQTKVADRRAALLAALPLILFATLQAAPGLLRPFLPDTEGPRSGLEEWSRNELLLLERGDPDALRLIGESRSEALAVMRETMRSYTRGNWLGQGFLEGRVSSQIRTTATREHVVTGLLASQWGAPGTLGLLALLAAVVRPLAPAARSWSSRAHFVSATALLTFSTAGLYMVFANYGWAMFTGKNVYLLGLDSLGDTLEALALLGVAAAGLAAAALARPESADRSPPGARDGLGTLPSALDGPLALPSAEDGPRTLPSAPDGPPSPPLLPAPGGSA